MVTLRNLMYNTNYFSTSIKNETSYISEVTFFLFSVFSHVKDSYEDIVGDKGAVFSSIICESSFTYDDQGGAKSTLDIAGADPGTYIMCIPASIENIMFEYRDMRIIGCIHENNAHFNGKFIVGSDLVFYDDLDYLPLSAKVREDEWFRRKLLSLPFKHSPVPNAQGHVSDSAYKPSFFFFQKT
jgi:hypothetical protein